jgi:hypothetical protein
MRYVIAVLSVFGILWLFGKKRTPVIYDGLPELTL